jgi:hypothetical protein
MSRIGRHLVESEIRAALRAKARGLPLSPHAEAALLWIAWLRRAEGDQAAKRLLAWVVGTSLTSRGTNASANLIAALFYLGHDRITRRVACASCFELYHVGAIKA